MSVANSCSCVEKEVWCTSASGLHRMAYVEWGARENPRVLLCVHGMTRNGRDFDFLARSLAHEYRIVCPDVVGRGCSDWLADASGYGVRQYLADMMVLIARLDVEAVDWLGTSLGGIIGMALAALPHTPIRRLLLNDIGPVIETAAIARIGQNLGRAPLFSDMDAAERYLRQAGATFGALSDDDWRHLTETSVRRRPDGTLEMRYDPRLAESYRRSAQSSAQGLWEAYDRIRCQTLVLRGAESDLLSRETCRQMGQRGPGAKTIEVPGVGHAPMLMNDAQVDLVRQFLLSA